jgi:undecaprenyl-diphosphatase
MNQTDTEAGRTTWLRRVLAWLGRHELVVLVVVCAVAGGIWGFAELADEVIEGETQGIDERVLLALRNPADRGDPIGPAWLEEVGRDFTALGGVGVLTLITLAVAGFLALERKLHAMLFVLAAVGGALLASTLLKELVDRPRPQLVPHASHVYTASFPSGHSLLSAATYLTLGALLARTRARGVVKAYVLLVAACVAILVGVSRVYVGVHWPTDVLAGWTAGAVWAMLCWLLARRLQRRGRIESAAG